MSSRGSLLNLNRDTLVGAAIGSGGLALSYMLLSYLQRKQVDRASSASDLGSTTSSGHSGNVYESNKAVAEYLMFHFGAPTDILPYAFGPRDALEFASRTAALCTKWCRSAGLPLDAALDVGCAVGRTSFDLSRDFAHVVGVDFSHAFVAAANRLKEVGSAPYTCTVEGDISEAHLAVLPSGVNSDRIRFVQGDACALGGAAVLGGPFSVIHGANLLCRLPDPDLFLSSARGLLAPGGLLVLVSPYSWLPQYTPKAKWIGGTVDAISGVARYSSKGLQTKIQALGFELIHQEDVPFLIREHARKFQWGCSHATIWRMLPKPSR